MLPLVNCIYSGEVRATAALALSQVFRAACLASAEDLTNTKKRNTCQHILNVLPKALVSQLVKENDEEDVENRDAIADALSEVMYDVFNQVGPNGERVVLLSASDAKESVSSIMNLIELTHDHGKNCNTYHHAKDGNKSLQIAEWEHITVSYS